MLRHLFGQIQIEIILNTHIKYTNNNLDSIMVIDNNYKKKKLLGFIKSDQLAKELDDLLKYFGAENVQPDEEQTKKILSKMDLNKELLQICE
jgi:hypothetical protein